MNACSHCWHEVDRKSFIAGDQGTMTKTERCCHCAEHQAFTMERVKPEGHGRHAPSVWAPLRRPA